MNDSICAIKHRLSSVGLLWLRVLMGTTIAWHGYVKIFGGYMAKFAQGVAEMGFPAPQLFAWLAAFSEFGGGILIVLGLGTRAAAAAVFFTMAVAFFIRHAADAFQVKELAMLYGVMAGTLILTGPGRFSLDALFFCKPHSAEPPLKS